MIEPTLREQELTQKLTLAASELTELRLENKLLREKLDAILRKLFRASSETLDPAQLELLLQGITDFPKTEEPVAAAEPQRSKAASPKREHRPRTPDDLPIVEERIVPEPVKSSPGEWRHIGEEVTELLDYQPAHFFKRHIIREKYARKDHPFAAPIIAPLDTLQERCVAAPGLIAAVVVANFCDHLPLYRQEKIFATRHRVHIPRATLAQWMGLAADWLQPIYKAIHDDVLAGGDQPDGGYVQVDETVIKYLAPGHGATKQGYLWVCSKPGGDAVFPGTPPAPPTACKPSSQAAGAAPSNATATPPTPHSPANTTPPHNNQPSNSEPASPTSDAKFTTPKKTPPPSRMAPAPNRQPLRHRTNPAPTKRRTAPAPAHPPNPKPPDIRATLQSHRHHAPQTPPPKRPWQSHDLRHQPAPRTRPLPHRRTSRDRQQPR